MSTLVTSTPSTHHSGSNEPSEPAIGRPLRGIKRAVVWTLGAAMVFVLFMGLLHTKLGAPLLAKLGVGCPVRPGTPEQVDGLRAFVARSYAGKAVAPARPVLGFEFEKTTLAEVEAWAEKAGVSCEKTNGTETLRRCSDVPASALGQPQWFGPVESVGFEFRANRTLAAVSTMRRKLPVQHANAITAELSKQLGDKLGVPTIKGGENNPEHFAKGPIQAYKEEWTFGNYGATLSEVRLADTGVMVREHYISPVP